VIHQQREATRRVHGERNMTVVLDLRVRLRLTATPFYESELSPVEHRQSTPPAAPSAEHNFGG
jgi:hypothetical protein